MVALVICGVTIVVGVKAVCAFVGIGAAYFGIGYYVHKNPTKKVSKVLKSLPSFKLNHTPGDDYSDSYY